MKKIEHIINAFAQAESGLSLYNSEFSCAKASLEPISNSGLGYNYRDARIRIYAPTDGGAASIYLHFDDAIAIAKTILGLSDEEESV